MPQKQTEQKTSTSNEKMVSAEPKSAVAEDPIEKSSNLQVFVVKAESSLAAVLGKIIVFALVSFALVVANFFLESRFASVMRFAADEVVIFDYTAENYIYDNGIIRFSDDPAYGNPSLDLQSVEGHEYIFRLNAGKLWGNFIISDANVNILIDRVLIIPDHASFDLSYDGSHVELATYDGDVYIGFLPEGIGISAYENEYSDLFMNRLLVPRDTQISIPLKKVTEEIRPLLSSKLVKEFKYAAIASTGGDFEWVSKNLEKDTRYIESVKQKFVSEVIHKGSSAGESLIGDFVFWVGENLTFIPGKKRDMILDHLFVYLDDAIFYANVGDEVKLRENLDKFDTYSFSLPVEMFESEEYYERFDEYIDKLMIFGPNDSQYAVLDFLLAKKFAEKRDIYGIVNAYWLDVYEGMDISNLEGERALNKYYDYFDRTLGDVSDKEFYRMNVTYQNQLFDNLFLRYSLFYGDGYFAIKNVFEQTLLGLYDGQLREELKQVFIGNKINFLKRLRKFFFEEELGVIETKEIFSRLIDEVDELMPADTSAVAVIELFQSQLADIDDFWGYLNSPDYHTKVYGLTHEVRYGNYLKERETIFSFIDIQEEVLGEGVKGRDVISVLGEIKDVFAANDDISDLEIGEIESVDQRYVSVRALIGGYPFDGLYDRDTDLLKDVYVYKELISAKPLKMDGLLSVLQSRFAELAEEIEVEEEEVTLETTAQRYARIYIANRVSEFGFVADLENISVLDELNAIYRIEGVVLEGYEKTLVTFDINMNGEIVINVFMFVEDEAKVFDGKYGLEEVAAMVVAEQKISEGIGIEEDRKPEREKVMR